LSVKETPAYYKLQLEYSTYELICTSCFAMGKSASNYYIIKNKWISQIFI